ncbi:MAG: hypothetical protein HGB15_08930 [Chlorobaculum sp.]|nr:hypothetical protein [Chlorobaculum sp.]
MAKKTAFYAAEEKIAKALRTGTTRLDLSCDHLAQDSEKLTELPESLGELTQLQWLDLSNNKLTKLSESLSQLTQLQSLDISSNKLTALPKSLGELTQLQWLDLSNNRLTALPELLGQLTQLQSLDLSNNKLTALPELLGQLTQLQSLDLSNNKLMSLPESLGQLTHLRELNLLVNHLGVMPEVLRRLSQLETLYIWQNGIVELPDWIGELESLRILSVNGNDLKALPSTIGNLRGLKTLTLGHKEGGGIPLAFFPECITRLRALEELNLFACRIDDLPSSLVQLDQLKSLDLDQNPLNPELAAAYEQGLAAVKRYLRAKADAQVVLNEAKLILIGEGEVGKSCLLGALRDDPWEEARPTTHGIEIKPVKVTDPGTGTEITLNGWDFGGQRVYRPTHQLFFTAPAVYLVVWKPREGPQQGFVKEWIKLVKHREPEAKIIVVATHGGPKERQPDIDRQEIWDLFGRETVVDFISIDSKPNEQGERPDIEKLKTAIAEVAASLPEMGRTFPKHWQDAREALRKSDEAYLPLDRVFAICKEHKVDEEDARLLLRICRRVGDLIHYEHDPTLRNIVILKPDWLATAISFVLDDEQTRNIGHGLVSFERLGLLWNDPDRPEENRYPADLHSKFLRLMERFDLSYQIAEHGKTESTRSSLVAQLVPDVRPEEALIRVWPSSPSSGDEQQVQICRIVETKKLQTANAEGIFFRLIVRLHKYSLGRANHNESVHWQRGLVLEDDTGARAFLEHIDNDVRITVRSPFAARFLSALTYEVKWLVEEPDQGWKGMRCEVTVPCLTTGSDGQRCNGLFNVKDLIDDLGEKRPEQKCYVCKKWHKIVELLGNAPAARPDPMHELLVNFAEIREALESVRTQIGSQHAEVIGRFDDVDAAGRETLSKLELAYTGLMHTLLDEAREGPRLFSFEPVEQSRFNPKDWVKKRFRVTLWCEHSRLPLPLINKHDRAGVIEFDVMREWFEKAAPFLKVLSGTLSLVLPVAASVTKLALEESAYKAIENQLDFGKSCVETMLSVSEKSAEWLSRSDAPELERGAAIRAQGAVLRQLHAWLKQEDPSFGGLIRVQNKRQEFLWVHPQFEGEY